MTGSGGTDLDELGADLLECGHVGGGERDANLVHDHVRLTLVARLVARVRRLVRRRHVDE